MLLPKTKLNCIGGLISKIFIGSCIMHDDFLFVDDALRKYEYMKEEIKNLKTSGVYQLLIYL